MVDVIVFHRGQTYHAVARDSLAKCHVGGKMGSGGRLVEEDVAREMLQLEPCARCYHVRRAGSFNRRDVALLGGDPSL